MRATGAGSFIQTCQANACLSLLRTARPLSICYNVTGFATLCVHNGNQNDRVEEGSVPLIWSLPSLQLLCPLCSAILSHLDLCNLPS